MTRASVLGCVMARDEWPVVGLAVEHALEAHVDHVVVLDHASTDQTQTGLLALQARVPGRVTVIRIDDPAYLQEAATALMLAVGVAKRYDWVYVFDADEFILPRDGASLGDVLGEVDDRYDVVRYQVDNWVSPTSFDESDLDRYSEIRHRAFPNVFLEIGLETHEEIEWGNVNFFDVPFPSKVVVRGAAAQWIAAGSHSVRFPTGLQEMELPRTTLRAGHVPLLSRGRLALKCRQGEALIQAGFPPGHGWQNQMLRRLEVKGELDQFWACHSTAEGAASINVARTTPTLVLDDALHFALMTAVGRARMWGNETEPASGGKRIRKVPADAAFGALRWMQHAEADLAARFTELTREHSGVVEERDAARAGLEVAQLERDASIMDRKVAVAERNAAIAERDAIRAVLDSVLGSRTWRYTGPLRSLGKRGRS